VSSCQGHHQGVSAPDPDSDSLGHVSPHVLMRRDDPRYQTLQKSYNANLHSWRCLWGLTCNETQAWSWVCGGFHDPCPRALTMAAATGASSGDDPIGDGPDELVEPDNVVRKLTDPQSLRGISEDDFLGLAKESGLKIAKMPSTAATGGRGWRAFDPADSSVNVFWEVGDPASRSSEVVHQGEYIKWQWRGNKEGFRVPGENNPNPNSGDTGSVPQIDNWKLPGVSDMPELPGSPDFPVE
jgi:hypothetical protein